MKEKVRVIECDDCNNWEEISEDAPRKSAESFNFISGDRYVCKTCSSIVDSVIVEKDGNTT